MAGAELRHPVFERAVVTAPVRTDRRAAHEGRPTGAGGGVSGAGSGVE